MTDSAPPGVPPALVPFTRAVLRGTPTRWPAPESAVAKRWLVALGWHGGAGLLYAALEAREDDAGLPPAAYDRLRAAYLGNAARNALLRRTLGDVLAALEPTGVRALLLKGAALLVAGDYPPGARPMGDVDLLVVADELPRAVAALEAAGWRQARTDAPDYVHHVALARPEPGGLVLPLELHRRLFKSPPYDRVLAPEGLLERAHSTTLDGHTVWLPDPVDLVLHLAGHLAVQHARTERLVWVADVDRVLRRMSDAERATLVPRAAAAQLTPALADVLCAAQAWCGTPVDALLEALVPSAAERQIYQRLRRRAPVGAEGARLLTDLKGVSGWRARLRFIVDHLLPSPAVMRRWYEVDRSWMLPIYYARRALRGLIDIVRHRLRPTDPEADAAPGRWMIER